MKEKVFKHNNRKAKAFSAAVLFVISLFILGVQKVRAELVLPQDIAVYNPVDISSACNMGFADDLPSDGKGGWTDQGSANDFGQFPVGRQKFGTIVFDVIDPQKNEGRSCIVLRGIPKPNFPESATFKVERSARSIYFLHTFAWEDPGKSIAKYVITYGDGTKEEIPLVDGRDIYGWWDPKDTENSVVAWEGANKSHALVGINIFGWNNPYPDKMIKEITFETMGIGAVPILAGVTTSVSPCVLSKIIKPNPKDYITDTSSWVGYNYVWDDAKPTATSAAYLLDAPAGKHGFVKVKEDGHFYFEDGTRAKFWGIIIDEDLCFLPHAESEKLAARLAKLGNNIVRLSSFDFTPNSKPGSPLTPSIIDQANYPDTRHFSEENLERMDYFIAQLKKHGIYIYLDLLTSRTVSEGDGLSKEDLVGIDRFVKRKIIELQKEYAKGLFTHKNPYTGLRYCDDPAIALTGLMNEKTLSVLGYSEKGQWSKEFVVKWNQFLLQRYGTRESLAKAWNDFGPPYAAGLQKHRLQSGEDPQKGTVELPFPVGEPFGGWMSSSWSSPRLDDATLFIYNVEVAYYKEMEKFLREVGVKIPITGSQPLYMNLPDVWANAQLDSIDMHPYNYSPFPILKKDVWENDLITQMASVKIAGKPLIATEWNYHNIVGFPNYRAELPLTFAAYCSLQDYDALFFCAYAPSGASHVFENFIQWTYSVKADPAIIGQWPAAAHLFLRGDVQPAKNSFTIGTYNQDNFYKRSAYRHIDSFIPYRSRVETRVVEGKVDGQDTAYEAEVKSLQKEEVIVSDTKELRWNHKKGILIIDTKRTQAAVGFLKDGSPVELSGLKVKTTMKPEVSICLTSLDGKDTATSDRLLITAVGQAENTGTVWKDKEKARFLDAGRPPVLFEPIEALLAIKRENNTPVKIFALDNTGERKKEVPYTTTNGWLNFSVGREYATIYYAVTSE